MVVGILVVVVVGGGGGGRWWWWAVVVVVVVAVGKGWFGLDFPRAGSAQKPLWTTTNLDIHVCVFIWVGGGDGCGGDGTMGWTIGEAWRGMG